MLEYADEAPFIRQQTVWAWVCGGFAIHKTILCDMVEGIYAHDEWMVTHVNSGRTVAHYVFNRDRATRLFAAVQDVQVDGIRFGDMTLAQALAHKEALSVQMIPILFPNMRSIGGA